MRFHIPTSAALLLALLLSGPLHAEPAPSKTPTSPPAVSEQQKPDKTSKPSLTEDKAKILKDALAKARATNTDTNDQIKAKRKELAALLKTTKFDKAAFLAKHAEMQALIDKAAKTRAEALATVAETFTADDRKILAERFEKKRSIQQKNRRNSKQDKDEKERF